jgi:hypothetical protein
MTEPVPLSPEHQPKDATSLQAEPLRQVPKRGRLQYLSLKRDVLLSRHAATNHWLIASLLAVNSAGLIALAGLEETDADMRLSAAAAFFAGSIFALVCGYLAKLADEKELKAISDFMRSHPDEVAQQAGYVETDDLKPDAAEADTMAVRARWSGWASFVAFLTGTVLTGIAMAYPSAPPGEVVCELRDDVGLVCRAPR